MSTLPELVEQARGILNQHTTHRPIMATFTGWVGDAPYTGIGLSGLSGQQRINSALVELGHELVYVSSHDPVANTTLCPPWFRQQQGSPANDDYPTNSVAVVNPQWPYHVVARNIQAGIAQCYPSIFKATTITIQSETLTERYLLPSDVDEIHTVRIQDDVYPTRPEREVQRWTLDTKAADGNRYLHMEQVYRSGMPILITYRAAPVVPVVTSSAEWSTTGLPATAEDIPVLWAVAQMLPSADASKTQLTSVEQSERNRFVQPGAANAASRRFNELYMMRLGEERKKLFDRFPPRVHRSMY